MSIDLKNKLTAMQYNVTQENGTEPPFDNEYDAHFEVGIYVDIISGVPLFSSKHKFDAGCGWPAFSHPIGDEISTHEDRSYNHIRTEVRSKTANAHLGHVFNDGPFEGGLRYCINSAALRFIPLADLEQAGYGEYRAHFE